MTAWSVIGVDPAPSEPSAVFDSRGRRDPVAPDKLRAFIEEEFQANPATLIAWDAPLTFDPHDLYDRVVDKVVRAWAKEQVDSGHFAEGAVNARSFAALPHWLVSCATLGFPFGSPPCGLRLAPFALADTVPWPLVAEVHPAVAIGALWLASGCADPLPRYKGDSLACAKIASVLGFPNAVGANDDLLDSFVAFRLGQCFVEGSATWLGSPAVGGYLMPASAITARLQEVVSRRCGAV